MRRQKVSVDLFSPTRCNITLNCQHLSLHKSLVDVSEEQSQNPHLVYDVAEKLILI